MDYGMDVNKLITRTCKGWDRVTETGETRVKCGARYTTKSVAPLSVCPECHANLARQFWAVWERDNES